MADDPAFVHGLLHAAIGGYCRLTDMHVIGPAVYETKPASDCKI